MPFHDIVNKKVTTNSQVFLESNGPSVGFPRGVIRGLQHSYQSAMSLLDESLAISSELGMRPLMERVLSRREILKA